MAKTYNLYDPFVVHAHVLKSVGELKEEVISQSLGDLAEDEEFIREGNVAFLLVKKNIGGDVEEGKAPWKDVTTEEYKKTMVELRDRANEEVQRLGLKRANYMVMERFDIIVGGAPRDYWTEPQVEVDAFRVSAGGGASLADMTSTVRVASFNEELFSSPNILGNSMGVHKFSSNVYAFSKPSKKKHESRLDMPKTFLVEYEMGRQQAFGEKEEGPSPSLLRDLTSTLFRFIGLQRYFISMYKDDFRKYQRSSADIRDRIQKLHKSINSLLKGKATKAKGKKKKGKKEGEAGGEVALLHSASVSFTNLMELDERLSNTLLILKDGINTVERLETELDNRKVPSVGGGTMVINSLSQHLQSMQDTILFGFTNLRENIENSQTRLRNTVDSFKTYQENRRRATSEKSEKTFNTVFILLAVLTIGDAVGNFLVYANESGDILGAILGFLGILVALILVFGVVYMLVLRGMFRDS